MKKVLPLFALMFFYSSVAFSQVAVEDLGDSGYWFAQRFMKDGNNVCYAFSVPDKEISSFLVLTRDSSGKAKPFINLEVKEGISASAPISISIDSKKTFALYPIGNKAYSESQDSQIIDAFKKGNSAVVTYTTLGGDKVTEVYSLSGFTKVHNLTVQGCK